MSIHGRQQAEVADTGPPAQQVGVLLKVDIERIEILQVKFFHQSLRLFSDAENLPCVAHSIHHVIGFILPLGRIALGMQEVVANKIQVLLRVIPAIVHGRAQQAVGAEHIKQRANDSLARTSRLAGPTVGGFEVFDNGGAIANHLSCRGHQRGDCRQFALGQHLRLETLMTGGKFLKRNALFNQVGTSPP